MARKVINKASREAIAREVVRPSYQYDYSALLASRHGELVRNTLRVDDMVLDKLVDEASLTKVLHAFFRGHSAACYPLTNLICAEQWVRHLGRLTDIKAC
jgi:hypothetical protein